MPFKDPEKAKEWERAYRARKLAEDPDKERKRQRDAVKRYGERHPDRIKAASARWIRDNRDHVNKRNRAYRLANLARHRELNKLSKLRGRERRAGRPAPATCEICGADNSGRPMNFDHDHACCPPPKRSCGNCFRGWICNDCNLALGHVYDDPERLRALIAYLEVIPSR
jgi:hypothetical protein